MQTQSVNCFLHSISRNVFSIKIHILNMLSRPVLCEQILKHLIRCHEIMLYYITMCSKHAFPSTEIQQS